MARSWVIVAAVMLALAGCGDDPPHQQPGDGPDASPSPSGTASSTATDSPEPSAEPSVTPATGPRISLPGFEARFPEGWEVFDKSDSNMVARRYDKRTNGLIYAYDLPAFGATLDQSAAIALEGYEGEKLKPVRGENRVVAGVEGYVLEGQRQNAAIYYEFATIHKDRHLILAFEYERAADATRDIESVLASVRWK